MITTSVPAFDYVDSGMSLVNRSYVVFQAMACSDLYVALGASQFMGSGSPAPVYGLVVDRTDQNNFNLLISGPGNAIA